MWPTLGDAKYNMGTGISQKNITNYKLISMYDYFIRVISDQHTYKTLAKVLNYEILRLIKSQH
jgi:hypothetical protein